MDEPRVIARQPGSGARARRMDYDQTWNRPGACPTVIDATHRAPEPPRPAPDRRALAEAVLETAAVAIAVLRGPDLALELVNPAYRALSPHRELLGRPFATVWPEAADRLVPAFRAVLETGEPYDAVDLRIDVQRAPGGPAEEAYFSIACRRLPAASGELPALLAQVLDTTPLVLECRRAEARLLESERGAREEADQLGRRQEMLGAVLAHDLRNPIAAIAWTSKALLKRGNLDERQVDAVGRIATAARRMERLVEELLDFARARQAGGIPVERVATEIEPVCASAIRQQLDAHPGRQVTFARSGPGDGLWDPSRLEQLVSNLVGNALESSPEGAPVEVRSAGGEDELVLTVRNEGVIPPAALATMFDPFRRGDHKGSVGLGLYIVSEVVRAHGGEVRVTSDAAAGTCFSVRLPRSRTAR